MHSVKNRRPSLVRPTLALALVLALVLLLAAVPTFAGTIAETGMFSQYLGYPVKTSTIGNPTTSSMLFEKSVSPPLENEILNLSANATIDTVFGLVRSAATLNNVMDAQDQQDTGYFNEYAYASATITDTLHWSGLTPLAFTFDLDWGALYASMNEVLFDEENLSLFDTEASLSFSLQISGIPGADTYSRNFVARVQHQYELGHTESWRLSDYAGNTLASGSNIASFVHDLLLPAQGGPVNLAITLQLGSFVDCYAEGRPGTQNCIAASIADNTGYLQIAGDFTSENGYLYPGRSENGGGSAVPEPATLAPVGAALLWLAVRTLRRK